MKHVVVVDPDSSSLHASSGTKSTRDVLREDCGGETVPVQQSNQRLGLLRKRWSSSDVHGVVGLLDYVVLVLELADYDDGTEDLLLCNLGVARNTVRRAATATSVDSSSEEVAPMERTR